MKVPKIKVPTRAEDSLFNLFAGQYEIFILEDGKTIAIHKKKKTKVLIEKNKICALLRKMYLIEKGQTISDTAVNTVYKSILAIADNCREEITSVNGLLQIGTKIVFDIQGTEKYVEITKDKVQIIDKKYSGLIFIEDKPNAHPIFPNLNVISADYLELLKKVFGIIQNDVLFGVYLASLFIPNISHPLLILSGEYGAAKTTFARMVAKIVNPQCGDVSPMPKSLDDIATVIYNSYYTAFDNLSYISRDIADLLCLATTGGNYKKRKLYTDSDVSTMYLHNAISLNGLNLSFPYSDLMDRAIMFELPRISPGKRLSEEEVWNRFYSYLPDLQGCIFQLLSNAMRIYKNIKLSDTPRLADFSLWGYAVAEGIKPGLGNEFIRQYKDNTNRSLKVAAESNPLLNAISSLMTNIDYWEGSATELLRVLEKEYYSSTIANHLPRSFPTTANALSRKLNVLQNDLKVIGFTIDIGRNTKRYITITKNEEN